MTTKLKICGLTDPDIARNAVMLGVDYIGLIFHESSPRHVSIETACAIADAVHEAGGLIVPVFVDQNADDIRNIADKVSADLIQLHGAHAVDSYVDLRSSYECIVAEKFSSNILLDAERDFLLYDYDSPGSGKKFDWNAVVIKPEFRSFIAGGINSDTMSEALHHFHPFALDISSGVEVSPGIKDINKIKACVSLLATYNEANPL